MSEASSYGWVLPHLASPYKGEETDGHAFLMPLLCKEGKGEVEAAASLRCGSFVLGHVTAQGFFGDLALDFPRDHLGELFGG